MADFVKACHDMEHRYALACRSAATGKNKHCVTCFWVSIEGNRTAANYVVNCFNPRASNRWMASHCAGSFFPYWEPYFQKPRSHLEQEDSNVELPAQRPV